MSDPVIHLTLAEQQVPKMGEAPACALPNCPGERGWECGYGMAGGGCGVYHYCNTCDKVVDKMQDPEE